MQRRGVTIASESRGEREEELALFHEVRRRERERERKSNAVHPLPPHDADLVGSSYTFMQHQRAPSATKITLTRTSNKLVYDPLTAADLNKKDDDLLTVEMGKNDYDWLLTPPGTPLINSLDHNAASNSDDFLSRAAPFSSVQTLAAIKTSRFSSTKTELNSRKEGATLSKKPDLALRKGQNGIIRSNGSTSSSLYTSINGNPMVSKKTSLTPGSRSSSRPASPTKRPISSTHTSHPTTPTSRPKPSSAPGSHPTTPTSRPTTALSSRSGSSSVSSSSMITRKTGASSSATTPIRRLSGPQTQSLPLSAGVSRSSSVSKARPLPSRSVPTSRGSSPTTTNPFEWHQATATPAFSSESESLRTSHLTTNSSAKTNLTTPYSMNSRGSPVGSLSRRGATTSTTQAVFSSVNHSGTSPDISRKACSPSFAMPKSALLGISRIERQSSNNLIMSSNNVPMDRSQDIIARSTKDADKMMHSRRSLGSLLSPETTRSALQAKHLLVSPTSSRDHGGFNKHAPRRSLDYAMQHLNLCQGTSNGLCSLVSSTPVSSLLSSRHAETQTYSNNFAAVSNSKAIADYFMIASFEQDSSEVGEDFLCGLNFPVSPAASQSDHLASLVKDAHMNNWLGSQEYMDEGLDLMQVFEQGIKFESCESPLVCPHGGGAVNCDLCNVKMRLQMLNEKSKASFGANSQILGEA